MSCRGLQPRFAPRPAWMGFGQPDLVGATSPQQGGLCGPFQPNPFCEKGKSRGALHSKRQNRLSHHIAF